MSNKAIICGASYEDGERLRGAVSDLFDAFRFDVQGRSVLVKPNILGAFEMERGITAHPAVVAAVVAEVRRRGGRVSVGDNPGVLGAGANLRCAKACGIYEVCSDVYTDLGERPVEVRTRSKYAGSFVIPEQVLEADLVISLAKFKTHLLTLLTGAVKNTYGYLVGGQKRALHSRARTNEEFNEALVDVFETRPPDFAVIDAGMGMEGMGPTGGRLRPVGKIIGSNNCVTADAAMAMMMGVAPDAIPHLNVAKGRGLGENAPGKICVEGDFEVLPDFRMPARIFRSRLLTLVGRVYAGLLVRQPALRRERCERCGLCAKACPVGAIRMEPYPVFDADKCFSCFCCHEQCKQKAIEVVRRMRFVHWFRRPSRIQTR